MDNFFQLDPASSALGREGGASTARWSYQPGLGTVRVPSVHTESFSMRDISYLFSSILFLLSLLLVKRMVGNSFDRLHPYTFVKTKQKHTYSLFKALGFHPAEQFFCAELSGTICSRAVMEGSWPSAHDSHGLADPAGL